MSEIWKPVVGFEGLYEVSDQGRVRSLDRIVILHRKDGPRPWRYRGRLLKATVASHSYPTVKLPDGNGHCIHILILEAFIGPCPIGMECLHADGDKTNARLSNLRWGTAFENSQDSITHGVIPRGSKHAHAKLNETVVEQIRTSSESIAALAAHFNVHRETIRYARNRKTWRHVT